MNSCAPCAYKDFFLITNYIKRSNNWTIWLQQCFQSLLDDVLMPATGTLAYWLRIDYLYHTRNKMVFFKPYPYIQTSKQTKTA